MRGPAPEGWEQPAFDDHAWAEREGPLNLAVPGGSPTETPWFARRAVMLETVPQKAAWRVEGWGQFSLWLNGRRVQTISNGRTESYTPASLVLLTPDALAAVHAGRNLVAVELRPATAQMKPRAGSHPDNGLDFGWVEVKAKAP